MPYIGKTPTVGNFQVCDAISVVNGQAAYTLQVGGANVAPESANHMLVSLNGILQKPGSSFTISGSTMTFASNLATGDVIDFVQILGNVLDLGTPSDDTVTAAKLNDNVISGQTALTSAPDSTDELLISDGGTLKRIDVSLIGGTTAPYVSVYRNGDQNLSDATHTKIEFNAENVDSGGAFDSSTNYRYTPQTSGYYFVSLNVGTGAQSDNATDKIIASIYKNGSAKAGAVATRDWDTNGINYNDQVNTSVIVQLNGSSDYIEGYAYIDSTSGTPRVESGQASMHIFKMTE